MRRRGAAVATLLCVTLLASGCSDAPDDGTAQACAAVHAWVINGEDAGSAEVLTEDLGDLEDGIGTSEVRSAVEVLRTSIASSPGDAGTRAQEVIQACGDAGWEPPEG